MTDLMCVRPTIWRKSPRSLTFRVWNWIGPASAGMLTYVGPTMLGSITPLAATFPLYQNTNCLYLHDMAISSDFRGQSLAPALLAYASIEAKKLGLQALALVAVQGAEGYWAKQGFVKVREISAEQQAILDTYLPEIACYMVLEL